MSLLVISVFLFVGLFATNKSVGLLSPTSLFLIMQYIMACGTLVQLDPAHAADNRHALMLVITYTLLSSTTTVLALAEESRKRRSRKDRKPPIRSIRITRPTQTIYVLLGLSIAISVVYYQAIGYNLLVESLRGALSSQSDIAGLRLATYAGNEYFFPGYVNQFKNVLLPALAAIVITWSYYSRQPLRFTVAAILTMLCVLFLMGTGQRGALVTCLLVVIVYASYFGIKAFKRTITVVLSIGLPLFFIGSAVLGRSSNEMEAAEGFISKVGVQFSELMSRIFESNQTASVAAFRYVDTLETQWGLEWFQSFAGLLPGVAGSSLSNEIFAELYGSSRGTAPPSLWTSIYYNFGAPGIVLGPVVLAILYFSISKKIYYTQSLTSLTAIGMAGVTVLMATWIAGAPTYLLNAGLVVFILLWWWGIKSTNVRRTSHKVTRKSCPRGHNWT